MLGSRVALELEDHQIQLARISRTSFGNENLGQTPGHDVEVLRKLEQKFGKPTHIVNAIGVVKPRIDEASSGSVLNAIQGNSLFPRNLGAFCESNAVHLIQIATDCVFSGNKGEYLESDLHDPTDVYGKSKSLGEFSNEFMSLVRCSIIGRENQNKYSLVEWVNSQSFGASINGFTNHNWNGVTTKVFGMITAGIIQGNLDPLGKFHLVPKDKVSKFDLVNLIKSELGRYDINVNEFEANVVIDRTLSTELEDLNHRVWECSGFGTAPTISQMISLGL